MSVTSGFFNSQNGDRTYNAEHMGELFDGVIVDGVFSTVGNGLVVSASSGMNVEVGSGRAWFNRSWLYNDGPLLRTIPGSDPAQGRVDAVILDFDRTDAERINTIQVKTGTPSGSPSPPTMINTDDHIQVPLAYISVGAGVTSISAGDITNKVGSDDCPFATGLLTQLSVEQLTEQWSAEFDAWLLSLAEKLDEQTASNLQAQIDDLNERVPINKNLIVNSQGRVCQRGTSDTIDLTSATFSGFPDGPDRWSVYARQQDAEFTFQRWSTTNPDGSTKYWYRVYTDRGNASQDSSDLLILRQALPGRDLREWLKGTPDCQTMTFSCKYATNVAGIYNIRFIDVTNGREFVAELDATPDVVGAEFEVEIPRDLIGTIDPKSSDAALRIAIMLRAGSNSLAGSPPGAWSSANYSEQMETNVVFGATTGDYIMFTDMKLEYGSLRTPHIEEDFSDLLRNCQRFYEVNTADVHMMYVGKEYVGLGTYPNKALISNFVKFQVRKNSIPTIDAEGDVWLYYGKDNSVSPDDGMTLNPYSYFQNINYNVVTTEHFQFWKDDHMATFDIEKTPYFGWINFVADCEIQ